MSTLALRTATETQRARRDHEVPADGPSSGAPLVPGVVVTASAVLTALALVLYLRNRAVPGTSQFLDPVAPAVALIAPAVGWAIGSRRRPDVTAWLLCAGGLLGAAFFAEQYGVYGVVTDPGALPGATWMAWFGSWAWMLGLLPLTTLLLLWTICPSGKVSSSSLPATPSVGSPRCSGERWNEWRVRPPESGRSGQPSSRNDDLLLLASRP